MQVFFTTGRSIAFGSKYHLCLFTDKHGAANMARASTPWALLPIRLYSADTPGDKNRQVSSLLTPLILRVFCEQVMLTIFD